MKHSDTHTVGKGAKRLLRIPKDEFERARLKHERKAQENERKKG